MQTTGLSLGPQVLVHAALMSFFDNNIPVSRISIESLLYSSILQFIELALVQISFLVGNGEGQKTLPKIEIIPYCYFVGTKNTILK